MGERDLQLTERLPCHSVRIFRMDFTTGFLLLTTASFLCDGWAYFNVGKATKVFSDKARANADYGFLALKQANMVLAFMAAFDRREHVDSMFLSHSGASIVLAIAAGAHLKTRFQKRSMQPNKDTEFELVYLPPLAVRLMPENLVELLVAKHERGRKHFLGVAIMSHLLLLIVVALPDMFYLGFAIPFLNCAHFSTYETQSQVLPLQLAHAYVVAFSMPASSGSIAVAFWLVDLAVNVAAILSFSDFPNAFLGAYLCGSSVHDIKVFGTSAGKVFTDGKDRGVAMSTLFVKEGRGTKSADAYIFDKQSKMCLITKHPANCNPLRGDQWDGQGDDGLVIGARIQQINNSKDGSHSYLCRLSTNANRVPHLKDVKEMQEKGRIKCEKGINPAQVFFQ